ncbi:uncharacterized protein DS421_4g130430 [Arachis hypogaea]|nr:uncharacterized protein DS421_4g130430 [Arachis hypogaea]
MVPGSAIDDDGSGLRCEIGGGSGGCLRPETGGRARAATHRGKARRKSARHERQAQTGGRARRRREKEMKN